MSRRLAACGAFGAVVVLGHWAFAQQHMGEHRHHHGAAAQEDSRVSVQFPPELAQHTLANMRDHLLALQEIQQALAGGQEDKAARIAEERLGMSSLEAHGAHEVAQYMPKGMQDIGTEMHRSASRFAIEAQDAGVTGDVRPALEALSHITAQCVGCHAGYRFR
jgi:hypothetical protein